MFNIIDVLNASVFMLIVINPFSKMFYIASLKEEYTSSELRYIVSRGNLIGLIILVTFSIAGSYILTYLFHVDVLSLKIAGGIVLAKIGYDYLEKGAQFVLEKTRNILEISAYPVATPLIAGPAAITAVITISAEQSIILSCVSSTTAILLNSLFMYLSVNAADKLGKTSLSIFIRILGLFIMAMGIHMILTGVKLFVS